jgi:hypothetical protein
VGNPSLLTLNPSANGSALSVAAVVNLASVDITGMALGTLVWSQDVGAHFVLSVSAAAVDHSTVEAVAGNTALRWVKFAPGGGGNTITLSDAGTNNQPDLLILRHLTSALAAAGFGGTVAVELEVASGNVLRGLSDVLKLVTATPDGSVEMSRTISLMVAGALAPHLTQSWVGGSPLNARYLLGDPAGIVGFQRATNQIQFLIGGAAVLNLIATQLQPSVDIAMQAKRIMGARGAPIAVAASITLGTDGNSFPLTVGTGTLNAINVNSMPAGTWFVLELATGITITHNVGGTGATIQTSSAASIVAPALGRAVWCYYNGTVVQALA